jgi:RNA polymerase sigma factor (sigma-70 family)
MTDASDMVLVERARGGDHQAFAALLGRHSTVLLALCRRALGDALLAEDAAQEASLQAFLNLERLRDPAQFGPWLHGIGLNMCRRTLRMRSRDAWSWEAIAGGTYVDEPPSLAPGPSELAEAADLRTRIQHAVNALPSGQRAAVVLFYLSGLSYADVALTLGINVSGVKTRLHKARASLRHTLWTAWKEEDMSEAPETATTSWVEMRVVDVWQAPRDGDKPRTTLVALKEVDGPGSVVMWIGMFEGESLAMGIEKVEMPRPFTYTFMARLLEATGGQLREVRISQLVERTYYAEVVVEGPSGTQTIDARPSDALNLAVLTGTRIHVAPEIIEQSSKWLEHMRQSHETGEVTDMTPPLEVFEQLDKMAAGEAVGGAAAIVAQLQLR